MAQKIRIGCIGTGSRGRWLLEAAAMHPAVEITALCDVNPENIRTCQAHLAERTRFAGVPAFSSYEEMLARDDVDAVIVATHIAKHAEAAVAALEAGKHVLSEIPTIGSVEDAKAILKAADAHPELNYMAGENCCYWAFIRKWKELYEAGKLGDVLFAESDYLHQTHELSGPTDERTWRSYLEAVTYITHNLGPILFIMNDKVTEVSGFTPPLNPIEDCHPAQPNGVTIMKTEKGALVKIFNGFGVVHGFAHNFILYGTKGSVENSRLGPFDERHSYLTRITDADPYAPEEIPVGTAFPGKTNAGHGGADPAMVHEFIQSILEKRRPELDAEFGVRISLPGVLSALSAKQGNVPIPMPSMDELRA